MNDESQHHQQQQRFYPIYHPTRKVLEDAERRKYEARRLKATEEILNHSRAMQILYNEHHNHHNHHQQQQQQQQQPTQTVSASLSRHLNNMILPVTPKLDKPVDPSTTTTTTTTTTQKKRKLTSQVHEDDPVFLESDSDSDDQLMSSKPLSATVNSFPDPKHSEQTQPSMQQTSAETVAASDSEDSDETSMSNQPLSLLLKPPKRKKRRKTSSKTHLLKMKKRIKQLENRDKSKVGSRAPGS
eukprot:TRINITY_DN606_c0_g1_i14.p1 TRINITY_DN606_c0_g1~~TRINITY_DN606_c0_g1_i14.p1  ORF type:complete len:242 (-),score=61.53 TRINITY_DN606_c0_g1_i14:732-1457(-)